VAVADRVAVAATRAPRWPTRLVVASTLVCAALVLFRIGAKGLWFDEGFSVGIVDRPFGEDRDGAAALVAAEVDPGTALVVRPWGGVYSLRYDEEQLSGTPLLQPRGGDPPVGTELVEVLRRPLAGGQPPADPSYTAWRDQHDVLRDEHIRRRVAVRTYDRVPVGEAAP
jgi:hypothetical protein